MKEVTSKGGGGAGVKEVIAGGKVKEVASAGGGQGVAVEVGREVSLRLTSPSVNTIREFILSPG